MSKYYWTGSSSSNVGVAANWTLYPLVGATLPPAASSAPTGGDEVYFTWSHNVGSQPINAPVGSLTGGILLVNIVPEFELDIGSESTPFGISADIVMIHKKYQSTPAKGTDTPSVYIKSLGSGAYIQTSMWGDAGIPSAFGASADAPQCYIDIHGDFRTLFCGQAIGSLGETLIRSEIVRLGNLIETNFGGVDDEETLIIDQDARTTLIFGSETNVFTKDIEYQVKQPLNIKGSGVTVKIGRGADFNSNCGGIDINASYNPSSGINTLHFERAAYAGATGYDSATRTAVADLKLIGAPSKIDPYVLIEHGVDITRELSIGAGKFVVTECQEVTRTYGAGSFAKYYVSNQFSTNPRVEIAENCSLRHIKLIGSGNSVPDIVFDAKPFKTLFINQPLIEGYTGL